MKARGTSTKPRKAPYCPTRRRYPRLPLQVLEPRNIEAEEEDFKEQTDIEEEELVQTPPPSPASIAPFPSPCKESCKESCSCKDTVEPDYSFSDPEPALSDEELFTKFKHTISAISSFAEAERAANQRSPEGRKEILDAMTKLALLLQQ